MRVDRLRELLEGLDGDSEVVVGVVNFDKGTVWVGTIKDDICPNLTASVIDQERKLDPKYGMADLGIVTRSEMDSVTPLRELFKVFP